MFDRYSAKISTVRDEERKETHLISSTLRDGGNFGDTFCSTRVRTIPDSYVGPRGGIGGIEFQDSDVMRYALTDNDRHRSSERDSDLEMIDLVDVDEEECSRANPFTEIQKISPLVRVPLASSGIFREQQGGTGPTRERIRVSEQSLFEEALAKCQHFIEYLKDDHGDGRKLRITHALYERREYGLMSARMRRDVMDRERKTVGVLWQTMTRPQKAVCVSFSISDAQRQEIACTCDLLQASTDRERCEHVQVCCGDEGLMSRVELVLRNDAGRYFGTHVHPELDAFPAAELQRHGPRIVTERTQKAMLGWSFWVVFDTERGMFAPVLRANKKPFQCQMCRTSTLKRGVCTHESACAETVHAFAKYRNEDDETESEGGEETMALSEEDVDLRIPSETREELEKYMLNDHQRTLLMCPGDTSSTIAVARQLERLTPGAILRLSDCGLGVCPGCGKKMGRVVGYRLRQMRLYTLSHGVPRISVIDWECRNCDKMVYFTGKWVGVFPGRRKSAFTVELLYVWLQIVCYQGQSLRTAYYITRMTGSACSTLQRFITDEKASNFKGEETRSRRRANEVFRSFLRTIDVKSEQATSQLFSCADCEVPLTESDKRQLGLSDSNTDGMKRFKAVVIDGTAAGILGSLPSYRRKPQKLRAPRNVRKNQRMIKARENRQAIKELCSLIRKRLRHILNGSRKRALSGTTAQVLLSSNSRNNRNNSNTKTPRMRRGYIDILRMYIDSQTCICGRSWLHNRDHGEECWERHRKFEKSCGSAEAGQLLEACFSISLQSVSQDQEADSDSAGGDEDESLPDRADDDDDWETGVATGGVGLDNGVRSDVWAATLRVPVWRNGGQLAESLLDVVEFLLTEHTGLVYILPFTCTEEDDNDEHSSRFVQPGVLKRSCAALAESAFKAHDRVVSSLNDFAKCSHTGASVTTPIWPCEQCRKGVEAELFNIVNVNPVVTRFCQELLNVGARVPETARRLAQAVSDCLNEHIETASNYFQDFDMFAPEETKVYWEEYASVLSDGEPERAHACEWTDEEELTGICFPGRRRYRPGIVFEGTESHNCTKKYPVSERHSPGILTVQCACENPKLIGFIIMTRAESTALALSAVLTHFRIPPRVVYYDNACNLFASTMLRTPWLLHMSRVIVDRFHYKGHKCSSFFDPDSYSTSDSQRTASAESLNARIDKAVHHMRYLNGENLVPFLRVRFALLNLAASYQQRYKTSDMEDVNLSRFLSELIPCDCPSCEWLNKDKDRRRGLLPLELSEDENEEQEGEINEHDGEHGEREELNGEGVIGDLSDEEAGEDGAREHSGEHGDGEIRTNSRRKTLLSVNPSVRSDPNHQNESEPGDGEFGIDWDFDTDDEIVFLPRRIRKQLRLRRRQLNAQREFVEYLNNNEV